MGLSPLSVTSSGSDNADGKAEMRMDLGGTRNGQ